jgi:hypothetical protein
MGVIRGVLKEELDNSIVLLKRYNEELEKVKGCLVRKCIKGRYYYYIAKRQKNKVVFIYKGPSSNDIKKQFAEQNKIKIKYKKLRDKAIRQIKFLRRALRGKEAV